jgi:hypothetical protein
MIEVMGCIEKLNKARELADSLGCREQLEAKINYLEHYGEDYEGGESFRPSPTLCKLYADFAPHSFFFLMQGLGQDGKYRDMFSGGLIYHPGIGEADKSLSVQLNPSDKPEWQIHT